MFSGLVYHRSMRQMALLIIGPVGAYAMYQLLFTLRVADPDLYPSLAHYLTPQMLLTEAALLLACAVLSVWMASRYLGATLPRTTVGLPVYVLALLTAATFGLMALTIYRVFGRLSAAPPTKCCSRPPIPIPRAFWRACPISPARWATLPPSRVIRRTDGNCAPAACSRRDADGPSRSVRPGYRHCCRPMAGMPRPATSRSKHPGWRHEPGR